MAVKSSGTIGLTADVAEEFGGSTPHNMSEYYRNAGLVGSNNTSVPASGALSLSDFYGATGAATGTLTASTTVVNEGQGVTFTLPTTGYANGTTFPYTITGVSSSDISQNLSGNISVSNNSASITINTVADNTTEGTEYMVFSVDGQSRTVQINDTSLTPLSPDIQLVNTYTTTVSGAMYGYTWPGGQTQSIGSNIDYGSVNGNPKTIVINGLSWNSTSSTGVDLNSSYGMRSYFGGYTYWNILQNTGHSRYSGMAFGWLPAANIGFYKPQFAFTGQIHYMQWTQWTLYAEAGIPTSNLHFASNWYNGQGSVSVAANSARSWNDYIVAIGTTDNASSINTSYRYGRMTFYSSYQMPNSQQGYHTGAAAGGSYYHAARDYYLYSSGLSFNCYPRAPYLSLLHIRSS